MRYAALLPLALLTACGAPQMRASRPLWRGVQIENTDTRSYVVQRVIANNSPENSNCNNYPNTTLAPGQTQSIVFLLCGTITHLDVVTDQGTTALDFGADGAQ